MWRASSMVAKAVLPFLLIVSATSLCAIIAEHNVFGVERNIDIPQDDFPTADEIEELEQAMPPHVHGWFDSVITKRRGREKAKLHFRQWLPTGNTTTTKAVAVFTHGIQTHSGKSYVFPNREDGSPGRSINTSLQASGLLGEGIAFYAWDLYGHGYSEGDRFFIPGSYEQNTKDLLNFVRFVGKEHEGLPIFLMGESYGGTLSLHAASYFQEEKEKEGSVDAELAARIESLLLIAPAIEIDVPPFPQLELLTALGFVFPRWIPFFMPNPVSPDRIWRDPQVRQLRTDPNYAGMKIDGSGLKLRLGTAVAVLEAVNDVRENVIPKLKTPFLTLHGTSDDAVFMEGSRFLFESSVTPANDKSFISKEGSYHDLLAEPDGVAEECMQDCLGWINRRLSLLR